MNSQKHILILTPGFPANERDTTCIPALQSLVLTLHRMYGKSILIQVVSFQYPFTSGAYTWNGIECWSAGGRNTKFPDRWNTWLRVLNFVRKLDRKQKIDVVHSFWLTECTLTGSWIARISGARQLAHIMGRDVLPSNRYMKYFSPNKATIIANSPFTAASLKESFRLNADHIIPFGLNPADFTGITHSEKRSIDILGVGSLNSIKNYRLFVDLFFRIARDHPGISGMIIGDGPLRSELEKQISACGLQISLSLAGFMDRRQVLKQMADSKILLHTSGYESAGYVFLEALYSGMKVVAFETGFLPDVPGAFACIDETAMENAVRSLLTYRQKYERADVPDMAAAAKRIAELYGIDV
jgi:glycosyltransferase involved in cell wall biosynthesis